MQKARQHSETRTRERRHRLAYEAARWMSESGVRDFHLAKRKAALRLGIHEETCLPANGEIEAALREYQRLFASEDHVSNLRSLRKAALAAMTSLQQFEPRLVGPVLDGTADSHSPVQLYVYVDAVFEFDDYLQRAQLKAIPRIRKLRMDRARSFEVDVRLLTVEGIDFDISVMPRDFIRQAPLSLVNDKPMARAGLKQVLALLED